MGLYHMGPPARLVQLLQKEYNIDLFLETGTYHGNTSAWASKRFKRVITVEASPYFAAKAQTRFAGSNVLVVQGSSATMLEPTLASNPGAAIFWLDAHWCGGVTAGNTSECPFFEEMALLNRRTEQDIILLDDARLFLAPPPAPHDPGQWPTLAETVAALSNGDRRYVIMVDDIFVAVPIAQKDFLIKACQSEMARRARQMFWSAKLSRILNVPW